MRTPRAWRCLVRGICLVVLPVVAGTGGLLFVLAADGFLTDVNTFAFWSLLPAGALATAGPLLLARLSRREPSRRTLMVAALAGGAIGGVITALVATVFGGMLALFGIPILPLWVLASAIALATASRVAGRAPLDVRTAVLDWDRLIIRTLAIGVSIVALPFAVLAVASAITRGESEVYRLPEGFTGTVVIVFNDSSGAAARYDGKHRVYDIPSSGMLRTQFSANPGWSSNRRYLFVSTDGSQERAVPFAIPSDTIPDPLVMHDLGYMYVLDGKADSPAPPAYRAYTITRHSDAREAEQLGRMLVQSVVYPATDAPPVMP